MQTVFICNAIPSEGPTFGMEIARPPRPPFLKGDGPCIMRARDFFNKILWIPACAGMTLCQQHKSILRRVCL